MTSLAFFILTFATGYITLFLAYFWTNRLKAWYDRDSFDKALQSFLTGSFISSFTILGFKPPLESASVLKWSQWLTENAWSLLPSEIFLVLITAYLVTSLVGLSDAFLIHPKEIGQKIKVFGIVILDVVFAATLALGLYSFLIGLMAVIVQAIVSPTEIISLLTNNALLIVFSIGFVWAAIFILRDIFLFLRSAWKILRLPNP